jgi:hypothetical protein
VQPKATPETTPGLSPPEQVAAIVGDQHNALIAQFVDPAGNGAVIACSDRTVMLNNLGKDSKGNTVGKIEPIEGISIEDGFVFTGADGKPELWARPKYDDYAALYDKFTKRHYGVSWKSIASGEDWHVDHLYPKAAAELDEMKYVRLAAIDAKANRIMGCAFELQKKNRAKESSEARKIAEGPAREPRILKTATMFTLGKLTGFHESIKLPTNRADFADLGVAQRLVAHVAHKCKEPRIVSQLDVVLTRLFATDTQTKLASRLDKREEFSRAHPEIFGRRS